MKQVLHDFRSGEVIVADVPCPTVQPNCVLVRNLFSAVSAGTERAVIQARSRNVVRTALQRKDLVHRVLAKARRDGLMATLRAVQRKLDASQALGYSSAGIVTATGEDVSDLSAGDLVACAGAGFANHAECVCVPRMLCARVPAGVAPEDAAFTTLGAIAMQGVRQAEVQVGEVVAVIGLGVIGQLAGQILAASGARCVGLDVDRARADLFARLCRGDALGPGPDAEENILAMTEGRGVDRVLIAAASRSNEVIELAAAICRERGRIVVVGDVAMNLPRPPFYEKELELRLSRSYGPGRYDPTYELGGVDYPDAYVRWTENRNMEEFLRLIQRGMVRPTELITHRIDIAEAVKAYAAPAPGEATPLGVVLKYADEVPAAAASRVEVTPRPPRKGRLGVGILGAGNFVRAVLLPTLARLPEADLTGIVSARGVNARDLAVRYKARFCATGFDDLLSSPETDAVFIVTPHHLHAVQAIKGLQSGKSVYLEKPLCTREEEIAAIVAAAQAAQGRLFVGYNRRFSPLGIRMREVFADRKRPITVTYRINAGALPSGTWVGDPELGGGRLVGEACHFVDFVKFVIGKPVESMTAQGTGESRDDAAAMLQFGDGSVGVIHYVTSGPAGVWKERVEALGAGKVCAIEDFRTWSLVDGRRREEKSAAQDKGHEAALRRFIACACGKEESPFTLEDLAETSRITFAMQKAAARRR